MLQLVSVCAFVLALTSMAWCDSCVGGKVNPKVFVSSDAVLTPDSVVVVGEFTVQCSNRPQSLNFLAEMEGEFVPVTKSIDGESYQFTVTRKPKQLSVGVHTVNLYDEQATAQLRKAQAAGQSVGEAIRSVEPTFSVPVDYQGPSRGLIVPSELVALGGGISLSLIAIHARKTISK